MWKPAVCTKDCPDTCGLLAKVEDGRITKIKADPDHPFTQGFICRKAKFFPEHVHNEKRILTPLKRKGPKGSGRFEPVGWDAALDAIAGQIQKVVKAHGPEAILPYFYAGHMGIVHRNAGQAFFHKLGASRLLLTICGPAATEGFKTTLGSGPSTDIESSVDSDFIIIWGSNTLTTNIHAWSFFLKARKKGARIVVIDPYRTITAQKADFHLMVKPGTDAALALGIMNILIQENLVKKTFIKEQTIGYEQLVLRAAEYPLEKTAEICGVSTRDIENLARSYGKAKAPFIRTGWGPARQLRGAMAMRTIACLPALVGAFDTTGGGITRSLGGGPSDITRLTRPDLCPEDTRIINMVELGNALTRLNDPPVKLFYNFMSNPAAVAPQSDLVHTGLAREDLFVVVHELFMTDTAKMADIILPSASFLEMTDIYKSYGHNYLRLAKSVIPPVGQSRTNLAIFQALAKRMGFKEEVFRISEDEFIKGFLEDSHPSLKGVDTKALMQGKAVRLNIAFNPYAKGFNTPSGKVEFFSQAWQDKGLDPLPCGQVWRDPQGDDTYPLELITPPHPLFLNSAFNEIAKIRTLVGRPTLLIHPDDAAARHIVQDAPVRVFNARGECRLDAKITTDTRPGLVVAEGIHWPQFMDQGKGINQLTSQRLTDQGETCAFHCSRVEVIP
ncbi:molybdopterin oxidoreductase family protein [Desulfobacter hydrogenophilus]|uniref:Molybdopterin oxidoreductase family protein n=1 Tax=Desulfobacter hydrogenophilus TaxID=2291 RepID=A0A328FJG0_9BACT|nr:molybdopterin oxidoreductase family protein [Desulfobacter hydrogenophilus]NDY70797.1 molybdopterin oxidoreductase family protein [Desulfobacter hydrogenophilus]QBH11569.1 molybdopterin oxidoreductase family protein [Desulfobacter hydrogenophilus]RAM03117.1 molybdopterin oxidoreductase family protein [Desulfobacter hydrogenophilus]